MEYNSPVPFEISHLLLGIAKSLAFAEQNLSWRFLTVYIHEALLKAREYAREYDLRVTPTNSAYLLKVTATSSRSSLKIQVRTTRSNLKRKKYLSIYIKFKLCLFICLFVYNRVYFHKMGLYLNKKTFFLITGASRGIGKTMAISVAAKLKSGSVIVLLARNLEALQKTKSEIESKRSDVTVQAISIDLSTAKAEQFAKILNGTLVQSQEVEIFDRALIIHNAGTLGDVTKKTKDLGDTEIWRQYYHTNVFSTIALNVEFFKVFATVPKLVVNVTSLCSIEPFISMGLYCSGKAAREMYFKVLAVEEKDNDTLVLNYAPGAIDTDMTLIIQEDTFNVDLKEAFQTQRDNRTMLTTQQTAEKFIKVLEDVAFETGAHIDYYDYDCFDIVPLTLFIIKVRVPMGLDLNKKTVFLVTGASRGIGKKMAIEVSLKLKAGSLIILMARNMEALEKTKSEIVSKRSDVTVLVYSIDLTTATAEQFNRLLQDAIAKSQSKANDFERAFIIHNAGTVGDVSKKAIDISNIEIWREYYHMNVFSTISLNVEFFKIFPEVPKLVVNISSKCAIVPFASMSFYCSGKAARDMYFSVLAVEEKDNDTLVLNYAPGAIDTDMTVYVQNETICKELHKSFKNQRDTKTMLTTEQTTEKFLKIIQESTFQSGAHIDYWD
ncbi:sepiapterin reductase [Haematobia irritans]|uniref:sepiapterin reductase n=1 Tax=Haematobia irritans TaxID=7368 RepID=UPI003F4F8A16